ncbi:MAG: nucleotide exchange factor GrpE [Clostridia bacterium]|nr:nucleotide exchange factor GrpE [Clostridia bacterium]
MMPETKSAQAENAADKENSQTAQTAENNETAQNEQACEKDCTQNEATDKKEKKQGSKKKKDNELEEKFKQLNDTYLRMLAEYDNYRKRTQKEKESMFSDGISKVVSAILPVIDNFERALISDSSDEEFKNGVDMIYKQLVTTLEGLGVRELECQGKVFDPTMHNAIMHIDDEQYGENEIVEVFQKGYIYKDETVLRHAVVKVAN